MALQASDSKIWQPDAYDPAQWSYRPRLIVKFNDRADLPFREGVERDAAARDAVWRNLVDQGVRLTPLFGSVDPGRIAQMVAEAELRDPEYRAPNFLTYFVMVDPPWGDLAYEVSQSELVETAYIKRPGPDPLAGVNFAIEPRWLGQGFLGPAPAGIDAQFAWTIAGGDGSTPGVTLTDLERGWALDHEDLAPHAIQLIHSTELDASRSHGTSVLGIICAADNGIGGVGIVPRLWMAKAASYAFPPTPDRATAMMEAVNQLVLGNVLLIEAQEIIAWQGIDYYAPVEVRRDDYDVIRLATARGIVVVEAAGNGAVNPALNAALALDTYTDTTGVHVLTRNIRDSGAILVTAATSADPHVRLPYAPHGGRIDCYAWGENISTSRSNVNRARNLYRPIGAVPGFDGTSGAAAIVAGAALAVQGVLLAKARPPLDAGQIRALLSNPAFNTAPGALETTQIGAMPDLRRIMQSL